MLQAPELWPELRPAIHVNTVTASSTDKSRAKCTVRVAAHQAPHTQGRETCILSRGAHPHGRRVCRQMRTKLQITRGKGEPNPVLQSLQRGRLGRIWKSPGMDEGI